MDFAESVAHSEQPEESSTRWIRRPPNLPPSAATYEALPCHYLLSDRSQILGDLSPVFDSHHAPQSRSLVEFQSDQQLADPLGYVKSQNVDLPEDLQRELAEAEWRYTATRYEILEKAHALRTVCRPVETAGSIPYAETDATVTEYTGAHVHSIVLEDPSQLPHHGFISNDHSGTYRSDVYEWSEQRSIQPEVYTDTSRQDPWTFGQQDDIFFNARNLDDNAFSFLAYGQQPAIDQTTFATSHDETMPLALDAHSSGDQISSLGGPTQYQYPLPGLSLQGARLVPVVANQSPIRAATKSICDSIGPSASLSYIGQIDPSADHSFTATAYQVPSFSAISHAIRNIDMEGTVGTPVPTRVVRGDVRREKRRQGMSNSPYDRGRVSGRAMDNIIFHSNPVADRQRWNIQPKTYSKRPYKSEWSCIGCRYSKRKVTTFLLNSIFSILLTLFKVHDLVWGCLPPMPKDLENVFESYGASKVYLRRSNKIF